MDKIRLLFLAMIVFVSGCSSMPPLASKEQDEASKKFTPPASGKSGVYIYRDSGYGSAVRKKAPIFLDNENIGYTTKHIFFHRTISPGTHAVSTGDSELKFSTVAGKNYYFRQYIKVGAFVGKPAVESVTEEVGKRGVLKCREAFSQVAQEDSAARPVVQNNSDNVNQKLRELQSLKSDGLITEEEFQQKKKQLLEKL
jgi:hypothetical protein